jgi:hypothetical protein
VNFIKISENFPILKKKKLGRKSNFLADSGKLWPVMDIRNYPKSFFGNHSTSWPGFDPRDGKFIFLLFYLI